MKKKVPHSLLIVVVVFIFAFIAFEYNDSLFGTGFGFGGLGRATKSRQVCLAGFANCDTNPNTGVGGCEVDTRGDVQNCNGCGNGCGSANGVRTCTLGVCGIACNSGFGNCDGQTSDGCEAVFATDNNNCGACGTVCTGGSTCSNSLCCASGTKNCDGNAGNGCEINTITDNNNCGSCGNVCTGGKVCSAGSCVTPSSPISGTTTFGNYAQLTAQASAGATAVSVDTSASIVANDVVIVHQTRSATEAYLGAYEWKEVQSVVSNSITFKTPLSRTYYVQSGYGGQVVKVLKYVALTVNSGGVLIGSAWNGAKGGILVINNSGALTVQGSINVQGLGYGGGGTYCGIYPPTNVGWQGESYGGSGGQSSYANAGAGGGGDGCYNAGSTLIPGCYSYPCGSAGGGGGHLYSGNYGQGGGGAYCGCGGYPGGAYGQADLSARASLGSGGGGGGGCEGWVGQCGVPGGVGGGVIIILTDSLAGSGTINANGNAGYTHGSGNGGGGASGGSVYVKAQSITMAKSNIVVGGGAGGGARTWGGAGSVGRSYLCSGGLCCSGTQSVCNGACNDFMYDNANCGSCGHACTGGTTCMASICCGSGYTNCYGSCVDLLNDGNNCGSCGNYCSGYACLSGTCDIPPSSSCPLLFTWNGSAYEYTTDVSGGPMGLVNDKFAKFYDTTNVKTDAIPYYDGKYHFKIREPMEEVAYVDDVYLLLIDHDPDVEIVPTGLRSAVNAPYKYEIYTAANSVLPRLVLDKTGKEVTRYFMEVDNKVADSDLYSDDYWDFDFGIISCSQNAKLLLDVFTYQAKKEEQLEHPFKGDVFPYLEVINKTGQFQKVLDFPASVADMKDVVIDLGNIFLTSNSTIRVHTGKYHGLSDAKIDRIRYDDSNPRNFTVMKIMPEYADLSYTGKLTFSDINLTSRLIARDDVVPIKENAFFGNFTHYGDVLPLLSAPDDMFVVMRMGDSIDVRFPVPGKPKANRTVILSSREYYRVPKSENFNNTRPDPLPFHGMTAYPYNISIENYPSDGAHQAYLKEWNTRICEQSGCYNLR